MALGIAWASGLLVLFVSVFVADRMGLFTRKNHFPVDGRVSTSFPLIWHGLIVVLLDCNNHRWFPRDGKECGNFAGKERCQCLDCGT